MKGPLDSAGNTTGFSRVAEDIFRTVPFDRHEYSRRVSVERPSI